MALGSGWLSTRRLQKSSKAGLDRPRGDYRPLLSPPSSAQTLPGQRDRVPPWSTRVRGHHVAQSFS